MFLEVKHVSVAYDTSLVLDDVSLAVDKGEFVGIVGANGAGKTTLLRTICGLMAWEKEMMRGMRKEISNILINGDVFFKEEKLNDLTAHKIANRGLILCPEGGRPFRELTVRDNLKCGAYLIKEKKVTEKRLHDVYALFPILKERENQVSGTLSGGERTMLAVARALMPNPEILLIDEPSLGIAPLVKAEIFKRIEDIYNAGLTILLVEQDANLALKLSTRNYVLSQGRIVFEGTSDELMGEDKIRKIYLGL